MRLKVINQLLCWTDLAEYLHQEHARVCAMIRSVISAFATNAKLRVEDFRLVAKLLKMTSILLAESGYTESLAWGSACSQVIALLDCLAKLRLDSPSLTKEKRNLQLHVASVLSEMAENVYLLVEHFSVNVCELELLLEVHRGSHQNKLKHSIADLFWALRDELEDDGYDEESRLAKGDCGNDLKILELCEKLELACDRQDLLRVE